VATAAAPAITSNVPAAAPAAVPSAAPAAVPSTAPAPAPAPAAAPAAAQAGPEPSGYGCAAALAYLAANANPEFSFECPGLADGNEAMTCINNALCPGEHLIAIADPCPAAYMNEAYNSNSWSDALGEFTRPIDPYGEC
jgi:hypothetical protein